MNTISYSEISTYLRCKLKWYWKYIEKLERKIKPVNLFIGDGIHKAIQAYYEQKVAPADYFQQWAINQLQEYENELGLWEDEKEKFMEDLDKATKMLEVYPKQAQYLDDFKWEKGEVEFVVPLKAKEKQSQTKVKCRIDGLISNDKGHWIIETKTTNNPNAPNLLRDLQTMIYFWGAIKVMEVQGVLYNLIYKWCPKPPTILKNNTISKSINTIRNTTYELYLKTIQDTGLDPKDYENELMQLKQKDNTIIYREYIYAKSVKELTVLESILWQIARSIRRSYRYKEFYPSISKNCEWDCDMKDLCQQYLIGGDIEFIKNLYYKGVTESGQ